MTTIEWAGERLVLHHERAVWWARAQVLFIADAHFGKDDAFRMAGVPVPAGPGQADLSRLDSLLDGFAPRHLVVLGDLLHNADSQRGETIDLLRAWRARRRALAITLIRGNHDLKAGDPPDDLGVACVDAPWSLEPFTCAHEPIEHPGFVLHGHVHPAVTLTGAGNAMKAPCFHLSPRVLLLPAFGTFTGTRRVYPVEGDRVFIVGPEEVMEARATLGGAFTDGGAGDGRGAGRSRRSRTGRVGGGR